MYEKPRVNVKVERRFNFYVYARVFIHHLYFNLRTVKPVNFYAYGRKNYATVEIHLYVHARLFIHHLYYNLRT